MGGYGVEQPWSICPVCGGASAPLWHGARLVSELCADCEPIYGGDELEEDDGEPDEECEYPPDHDPRTGQVYGDEL